MSSAIEFTQNVWIPMRDGVRLAGNLFRPKTSARVPCLVNYLPYHKDGRGGLWYEGFHRFFASRGYASMVIDFRGLGCSEGINNIPFDDQEARDGHDMVEWIAAQPWCDGNIGMWGSSYGGITSLKAAAENPPHLKAIVPLNATYCNYVDFLLLGGCVNGFWPNGDWGPRMIAYNLTPPLAPDPDGKLAKLFQERLENSKPWMLEWNSGPGWVGSPEAAERWAKRAIPIERIEAATLAVCGWKDFYVQGTFDYFERIRAPKKLIMGPWKHSFPDLAPVEPISLLEMMARWFDRWLKGEKNGSDTGAPITLFVQGTGVWRHEQEWPPRRNEAKELYLHPNGLLAPVKATGTQTPVHYAYDPTVGLDSIAFDPWTTAVTEPGDHGADDARSLTFTTAPLEASWEVTGEPRVTLMAKPSTALNFAVQLCDVDPWGRSRLVTMGWQPGGETSNHILEIPLRATSHVFARGHRIRVSIALADFPRLWPTPESGEFTLTFDAANPPRLALARTPDQQQLPVLVEFPPLGAPPASIKCPFEQANQQRWTLERELVQGLVSMRGLSQSRYELRDKGTITYNHDYIVNVSAGDPGLTAIVIQSNVIVDRGTSTATVVSTSRITPSTVSIRAELLVDNKSTWSKEWST